MNTSCSIFLELKELAYGLGFTAVGYAPALPLQDEAARFADAMQQGYFAELGYLKRNIEKREDPRFLVEGAKSVLVFLAPYGNSSVAERANITEIDFSNCYNLPEQPADLHKGGYKVAQYALGEDYHTVIKKRLNTILNFMKEKDSTISGRTFVDTAPVLERAWAVRAGLGFIGKNNFLISRECGVRNFIGVIISNFEIPPQRYEECGIIPPKEWEELCNKKYCGSCSRCIDACPTGALCSPYSLDANKCISYLTIESKGASPISNLEHADERNGWIFGCDACMNACPWNSRNKKGWSEFEQKESPLGYTHLRRR